MVLKKAEKKFEMQCDYILQNTPEVIISFSQQAEKCSTCLLHAPSNDKIELPQGLQQNFLWGEKINWIGFLS